MKKIVIIGMGTMGSAMSELLRDRFVVAGIRRDDSLAAVHGADVVVLAVKPQQFAALADELRQYIDSQTVISIMAGVTIEQIASNLGTVRVVRTMPNLALKAGQSLTAWHIADKALDVSVVQEILDLWGRSLQLDSEAQFDAFTALAGSGPAYFFELARVLQATAQRHGYTYEQAQLIAAQTFLGAASVVGSETDFVDMVQRVASKGGTTEAALGVLAAEAFADTVYHAVDAAVARSRELGNG